MYLREHWSEIPKTTLSHKSLIKLQSMEVYSTCPIRVLDNGRGHPLLSSQVNEVILYYNMCWHKTYFAHTTTYRAKMTKNVNNK